MSAHPPPSRSRRRAASAAAARPTAASVRTRLAWTYSVAATSRSDQVVSPPSAASIVPKAATCAAATPAAPSATSIQRRRQGRRASSSPADRSTTSAQTTPRTATACPERARPRSRTSTKAAMPSVEPEREHEIHGGADRSRHEKPRRLAEGREEHHDVDEVAAAEGVEHAYDARAAGGDTVGDGAPEEHRGRPERRHRRDGAEG